MCSPTEEGCDNYQANAFAECIGEGAKHIEGRNEATFHPVIGPSPRWIIKLSGLKYSENVGGRMAIWEFEENVVFQIFLGLFGVGLQSSIKDAFNVGRGCSCERVGNRNRSRRLAHVEGMRAERRNTGVGTRSASLLSIRR